MLGIFYFYQIERWNGYHSCSMGEFRERGEHSWREHSFRQREGERALLLMCCLRQFTRKKSSTNICWLIKAQNLNSCHFREPKTPNILIIFFKSLKPISVANSLVLRWRWKYSTQLLLQVSCGPGPACLFCSSQQLNNKPIPCSLSERCWL